MNRPFRVLALGEVLWDLLPDGSRFGGAPANFACACAELGAHLTEVSLFSAVGPDSLGREARTQLQSHSVQTHLVADTPYPTGRVFVTLDQAGQASYQFLDDCAWDHLTLNPEVMTVALEASVLYYGTLGQRSPVSAETLRKLILGNRKLHVCDLNLRPPHFTEETILFCLDTANILKLNEEELSHFAMWLQFTGSLEEKLEQLQGRYQFDLIALTQGVQGSRLLTRSGECDVREAISVEVVDTVGAGDAFTAAIVVGWLEGKPLAHLHQFACQVAAYVCTQSGGTPHFQSSPNSIGG